MNTKTFHPEILISCLSAKEAGLAHGGWVSFAHPTQSVPTQIHEILNNSPVPNPRQTAGLESYRDFGCLSLFSDVLMGDAVISHDILQQLTIIAHILMQYGQQGNQLLSNLLEEARRHILPSKHVLRDALFNFQGAVENLRALPNHVDHVDIDNRHLLFTRTSADISQKLRQTYQRLYRAQRSAECHIRELWRRQPCQ